MLTFILVDESLMDYGHIDMDFGGLDTVAEVTLNNRLILQSDDMFRRYSVNVKDMLSVRRCTSSE